MHQVFGIPGKQQGILDAIYQDDLCDCLESSKSEMEDREREVLKRPDETYSPRFWPYLRERSEMMASHMVEKVRREAGMAVGNEGKPLPYYINNSESMNNVMKSAKENFLKQKPLCLAAEQDSVYAKRV